MHKNVHYITSALTEEEEGGHCPTFSLAVTCASRWAVSEGEEGVWARTWSRRAVFTHAVFGGGVD